MYGAEYTVLIYFVAQISAQCLAQGWHLVNLRCTYKKGWVAPPPSNFMENLQLSKLLLQLENEFYLIEWDGIDASRSKNWITDWDDISISD